MHLLIYGADGATGGRLVHQALEAGHRVRASVHDIDSAMLEADRLEWVQSDVLDPETLTADMDGVDVVLNAVGIDAGPTTAVAPPPLHSQGTTNILAAMRAAGIDRFITISASFVETLSRGPIWFEAAARLGLKAIFDDMAEMERVLRAADDIRWTAVRPGWLLDEGPSGDFQVFDKVIPPDMIRTRTGDLAAFMLDCATEDLHLRGTPAIARPESPSKSGPDAVLREMIG
ncbi:MAG: NAD(P)H-binding protein [Pseudomonadota bacterium]